MRTKGARNKDAQEKDEQICKAYEDTGSIRGAARVVGVNEKSARYRLAKTGYYQRGAQNVLCPLYIGHREKSITCIGVEEGMRTQLTFERVEKRADYMNDFCRSKCFEGCTVYKYTAE